MLRHVYPGGGAGEDTLLASDDKLAITVLGRGGIVPCFGPGSPSARVSRRHGCFAVDRRGAVRFVALKPAALVPLERGAPVALALRRPYRLREGDSVAVGALPQPLTRARVFAHMHIVTLLRAPPRRTPVACAEGVPTCDVCTEPLCGPRVLPCGHSFCTECLTCWLLDHRSCPTCRAMLTDEVAASAGWPCRALNGLVEEFASMVGDSEALGVLQDYNSLLRWV